MGGEKIYWVNIMLKQLKNMRLSLQNLCRQVALPVLMALALTVPVEANAVTTRIKDIVEFEGVRDNLLVGYGLVVGLNGTGDTLGNSPFTERSVTAMLERLGVQVQNAGLNTQNIAAVMVTATLPPFTNQGARIDVNISSLGDSTSLQGGTLVVTPLVGADGEVYAVAQGTVNVSGFSAQGDASSVTVNTPTSGMLAEGAIVERELPFDLSQLSEVRMALRNPDFTTSRRIAMAINEHLGAPVAVAENNASVKMRKPDGFNGEIVDLITDIEQLYVQPDQMARVVIDERSGVIVMGQDVRISTVAIAQGNLTISINETPQVSQPNAFAQQGQTAVVPRTDISVDRGDDMQMAVLETGVSLQTLVESLNSLGISPRDVITILQSIKAAGALQADIEVM